MLRVSPARGGCSRGSRYGGKRRRGRVSGGRVRNGVLLLEPRIAAVGCSWAVATDEGVQDAGKLHLFFAKVRSHSFEEGVMQR